MTAKVGPAEVTLSRTGYTGDLGFEVMVAADEAVDVLDAVLEAGTDHGMRPFGEEALMMLRIEAGLPLIDVEWTNSRVAFTDAQRVTPTELGLGWMLSRPEEPNGRGGTDDRPFVGSEAIRRELASGASRWATVGIVVDWADWDRRHRDAGLLPAKDEHPLPYELLVYDGHGTSVGHVTSFMYSPVLQRHIGLARVRPSFAVPGTEVLVEVAILHDNVRIAARTAPLPLFNPPRKTAKA
jgi:aminomethyltransferase